MTAPNQKTVVVLAGPTGPTGNFEGVIIHSAFTGLTGQFPQWLQSTGATGGIHGELKRVYPLANTGPNGVHKHVIIKGYVGPTGS